MNIRAEQLHVFRRYSDEAFAAKAEGRLRKFFPRHTALMGDSAVSKIVRSGIDRARGYRLTTERGIQTYLSLMLYLGSEFHRDPQYPWVKPLLADCPSDGENARVNEIIKATGDFLLRVAGPNREFTDEALRQLSERGRAIITQPEQPTNSAGFRDLLREIYPEKAAYLGEAGLSALMGSAVAAARRYELEGPEPVVLFAFLMMLLGSYADEDPQFSWIPEILASKDGGKARFEKLLTDSFERFHAWVGENH